MKYCAVSVAMLVLVGGSAFAQRAPTWGDAFLAAEVGAVIGGAIGLGTVHTTCVRFEKSCDPLYKLVVLQQRIPIEGDPLSVIKLNSPGFHTVNMGRGIGALAGVALMSVMRGVRGNIWTAFVATQAWVAASHQIFLLKLPLVPALVATIAYSWGVAGTAPKTAVAQEWSFSVTELKF